MNFEAILLDGKQAFAKVAMGETCLSSDVLIDYGYEELDEESRQAATPHISACSACRMSLLMIGADRAEWESRLEGSPDNALAEIFGAAGKSVIDPLIHKNVHKPPTIQSAIAALKEAVMEWISPLWEPMWAGEIVTAADIPEQSHQFDIGDGEYIHMTCSWTSTEQDKTPSMDVKWEANLYSPSNIRVRFIDPETNEILYETSLGNELTGYRIIDPNQLGFDPSVRRFAISVAIEAV